MSSETICYSTLAADAAVLAIVSNRIFPSEVPQDFDLPAIAFVRTETEHVTTIHSDIPVATKAVLEVQCMAVSRESASALMDAVIPALALAKFVPEDRRDSYDPETDPSIYSDILVVSHWQP